MSGTRPDDLRPGTELFVNGNRENSNNYLIDGIDNNTRLTLVIVMRPNVEAIREFKVQTNLYSADQGRNPGGQVNVVTKSGGNTVHGAGYGFLRDDTFDANNFFSNRAGQPKPPFKQHQFGGAVGGPIVKNRTFFFADYDGFRQDLGRVFVNTVPDGEDAAGRLQRAVHAHLRPPDHGGRAQRHLHAASPSPATSFPPSRWDPVTAKLMNAYPLPTSAALSNNLVTSPTRTQDWNQFDVRVDHTQSERDNFLVRYSWSKTATTNPFTFPDVQLAGVSKAVGLGNEDTFAGTSGLVAQHAVLGWVHVFSPRLVLDTRVGLQQASTSTSRRRASRSATSSASSSACPTPTSRTSRTASRSSAPPATRGSARAARCPSCATRSTLQLVANLTYAADKHTDQGRLRRAPPAHGRVPDQPRQRPLQLLAQHHEQPGQQHRRPRHGLLPARRARASSSRTTCWPTWPSAARSTASTSPTTGARRSKLSLNLGLRYELDTPFTEKDNQWASFDPDTATVLVAGRNGVSETAGIKTFYEGLCPAPRLRLPARRPHRRARRGRHLLEHARATAATSCACTATCLSARSTASTPATSSSRGA